MTQTPYVLVPATTPKKRKPWLLIGIPVLVVLLAIGAAAFFLWPRSLTVTGTVVLTGKLDAEGTTCNGAGAFADIREGASVLIKDGAGATVAVGNLGKGKWTSGEECRFPFTVSAPAGKNVYSIGIAARKGPTFSEADATKPMSLSIGE